MALTDAACRNAKPGPKPYKLADAEGLHLHVTTAGSRVWRMKYRFAGREGLLTFGSYPDIKLAEARDLRAAAKKVLKAGNNPAVVKKRAAIQAKVSPGRKHLPTGRRRLHRQARARRHRRPRPPARRAGTSSC